MYCSIAWRVTGKDFIAAFIHTLIVETRSKWTEQHNSGSAAELSQSSSGKYKVGNQCLPTLIPLYSYTFAFTYRINLLNNAWQRFSSWSSEENPPLDQSTLWIRWLVWSKVAFLTSRTPYSGETEQNIITVKSMLHFKSGCSDKR